ncbi:MAG: nuclear transport factor 2 family protein [Oscillospiraceae bacterium]
MKDLNEQLKDLIAKDAIRTKLVAYTRAMDRSDAALGNSVFTEDSTLDYGTEGMFKGSGAEFIEWVNAVHAASFVGTAHQISNEYIKVTGDTATSETYLNVSLRSAANADGVTMEMNNRARYLDQWVCKDGEWFIKNRVFVIDFAEDRIIDVPRPPEATAHRDQTDISYQIL